jgi:hypothetical protein
LALIGLGYRNAWSLLCEVSLALLEPIVQTTLTQNVLTGSQTVTVASTNNMYVGALLVIGNYTANQEVVTITAVNVGVSFTAVFANTHSNTDPIITATFPTQAIAGDPFFTQAEMLSYLSRAQNEFLARVPCIFQRFTQNLIANQYLQVTPSTTIEINRVAISNAGVLTRLYETSQEELTMQDRNWESETPTTPLAYFEDRTGVYGWGVKPIPDLPYTVELLCAIRDSDSLLLTDGFLIPDLFLHIVKYKTLAYSYSKDGEMRNPEMESYCSMRFERGLLAVQRWMEGVVNAPAQSRRMSAR